ncbi:putative HAD family hydrolase [Alphaproteobacteria bacterium]
MSKSRKRTKVIGRPEAILFDWDNTIIQSAHVYDQILVAIAKQLNLDEGFFLSDVFQANKHLSLRCMLPRVFGSRWQEVESIHNEQVAKRYLDQVVLMPHVEEFLSALLDDGIVMSIVSNKEGDRVRHEVDKLGFGKYFYNIVGAGDAVTDKPAADPVYLALAGVKERNLYDHTVWFIGDSNIDMKCAYDLGCLPILFGNHKEEIVKVAKQGIKYTPASDFKSLLNFYTQVKLKK